MRKKNNEYYQAVPRSRVSYQRKKMNTVTRFFWGDDVGVVKVRITFTSRPAAADIALCLI